MAHYEQLEFINIISKELKLLNKYEYLTILDVGSYDVNGTVKKIFPLNKYLGIDLAKGPNVDMVLNGDKLDKLKKNLILLFQQNVLNMQTIIKIFFYLCIMFVRMMGM